jgi:hypothetical protein
MRTSVGGNVIRYPIAEGFDLDYTVQSTQLKQNLVIRERPVLDESVAAYFGVVEQMRLPSGYGLFLGDDLLAEEITQTQDELTIRNLETGEVLATVPEPVVHEAASEATFGEEPYIATYFIQVYGEMVVLTTAVDADWLMDEERQFPLAIDPSIQVMRITEEIVTYTQEDAIPQHMATSEELQPYLLLPMEQTNIH